MNVRVTEHAKRVIRAHVRSGRFTSEAEVVEAALQLLDRSGARRFESTPSALTEEDFQRRLAGLGLMSPIPDPSADVDEPDDQPVEIEGEPLSETVIRERR
jgi:Arc/MetJ-type ribon-helix-helix transcriptional regulator